MKCSTTSPEVDNLRRCFAVVAALMIAGMFIKSLFLAMLIVIAYALKFLGIALSAVWLTTLTAAAIAILMLKWRDVINFYEGVWESVRGFIDSIIFKKEAV